MRQTLARTLLVLLSMALLPTAAVAVTVNIGYVSWDVTIPGTAGQFDIINQTGPNSSGDPTWPVTTELRLLNPALTVHFTDGTTVVFDASYFTQSPEVDANLFQGLSFGGSPIPIGGTNPQPTDATLTGNFSHPTITLVDGSTLNISPTFSVSIPFRAEGLSDGDLQIITATTP